MAGSHISHPNPNCLVSANAVFFRFCSAPSPQRQDLPKSSCYCPSALRQLTRLLIVSIPVIQVLMVFIQPSRLSPEQGLFSFISWETSYVLNILLLTLSTPAPLMSLRDMPGPCPFTHSKPQLSEHPSSGRQDTLTPTPAPRLCGCGSDPESVDWEELRPAYLCLGLWAEEKLCSRGYGLAAKRVQQTHSDCNLPVTVYWLAFWCSLAFVFNSR